MILLDIRIRMKKPRDVDDTAWANNISEQIRLLWEHTGVPVVVCTCGLNGIVESKDEPRRRILCSRAGKRHESG